MNSQLFPFFVVGVCLLAVPVPAAQVLVSGNSMDSSNSGFTTALNTLGNTYTFVPPSGFQGTSLGGFNVVWLDGFSLYNSGLNTKLTAQFTQYSKFNGASDNYDGLGRNASDNNSIYLLAWFAF